MSATENLICLQLSQMKFLEFSGSQTTTILRFQFEVSKSHVTCQYLSQALSVVSFLLRLLLNPEKSIHRPSCRLTQFECLAHRSMWRWIIGDNAHGLASK